MQKWENSNATVLLIFKHCGNCLFCLGDIYVATCSRKVEKCLDAMCPCVLDGGCPKGCPTPVMADKWGKLRLYGGVKKRIW